jgi:acyl-CoA dehydrogenase
MYVPRDESDIIGKLEAALQAAVAAEPIERKVRAAQKAGRIAGEAGAELAQAALAAGVIDAAEHAQLQRATDLRDEVIRVDDFPQDLALVEPARPVPKRAVA